MAVRPTGTSRLSSTTRTGILFAMDSLRAARSRDDLRFGVASGRRQGEGETAAAARRFRLERLVWGSASWVASMALPTLIGLGRIGEGSGMPPGRAADAASGAAGCAAPSPPRAFNA